MRRLDCLASAWPGRALDRSREASRPWRKRRVVPSCALRQSKAGSRRRGSERSGKRAKARHDRPGSRARWARSGSPCPTQARFVRSLRCPPRPPRRLRNSATADTGAQRKAPRGRGRPRRPVRGTHPRMLEHFPFEFTRSLRDRSNWRILWLKKCRGFRRFYPIGDRSFVRRLCAAGL